MHGTAGERPQHPIPPQSPPLPPPSPQFPVDEGHVGADVDAHSNNLPPPGLTTETHPLLRGL